jgi:hypothetical protein
MRKQKRRIIWPRVWAATIAAYLLIGSTWIACDMHKQPERYEHCEVNDFCIAK